MQSKDEFEGLISLCGISTKSKIIVVDAGALTEKEVEGGFGHIKKALLKIHDSRITIVVPTCTPSEGIPKPTFDPLYSLSEMGPFSEYFRLQENVLRSHNPTHSVAASGPLAVKIISGHRSAYGRPSPWGDGCFGFGSPWDQLYENNAHWISLDQDWSYSPITAYICARYAQENQGITKITPFPSFNAALIEKILSQKGLLIVSEWNGHQIQSFKMKQVVDEILAVLDKTPELIEPDQELKSWYEKREIIRQNGYLRAGLAKCRITPNLVVKRWEGRSFKGVSRDLFVRAMVFEYAGKKVALVLFDLLGITSVLVKRIRLKVAEKVDMGHKDIFISCTHSHSTPDTSGSGFENEGYLESLVEMAANTVWQAAENLQNARIGMSKVPIRGIAQSRRVRLKDGSVFTTRYGVPSTWRVKPDLIAGKGEIDTDLTVVRVENLEGKTLGVISVFGCHASVALVSHNVSGDFPGEAMAILEGTFGVGAIAICMNGSAADVDPSLEIPIWGPRDDHNAQKLGKLFAAQVLECSERVVVGDAPRLEVSSREVTLPVRHDWFRLLESEQERMQQEFAKEWKLSPVVKQVLRDREIHTEVMAVRLNDLILIGFPGEVLSETGLRLKSQFSKHFVAVVELTNDNIGYIPTEQTFLEGGYEVANTLWGRVTPEGERILREAAFECIKELIVESPQN